MLIGDTLAGSGNGSVIRTSGNGGRSSAGWIAEIAQKRYGKGGNCTG